MTALDVLNGVKLLVEGSLPGETVHTNRVRDGFERPASLVQCGKLTVAALTHDISEWRLTVILTSFVEVDEYHDSHYEELVSRQCALLNIFSENCVRIGERHPSIEALEASYGLDYTEVKVTLSWEEAREETPGAPAQYYKISI